MIESKRRLAGAAVMTFVHTDKTMNWRMSVTNLVRPMLASKLDWNKLVYPVLVSPKIDGIRCIVKNGQPRSRSWKILPNMFLQEYIAKYAPVLEHCDGEIVVGDPSAPNVYNASMSGIMSMTGTPSFKYLIFDYTEDLTDSYALRRQKLQLLEPDFPPKCMLLPQYKCRNREQVELVEDRCVDQGYEGVVIRSHVLSAPYKPNRSTVREGYLLKLKRYEDSEAVVVGVEELMHNDNPAFIDAQGHTKHTSHKANQRPGDTLGALVCVLLIDGKPTGPIFSIGTGFDFQTRDALWSKKGELKGKIVKFKHLPHGMLDAPRHPVFINFRDPIDM